MFQETIFRHTHGQEVFSDSSVGKESAWMQETPVWLLGQEDLLEKG